MTHQSAQPSPQETSYRDAHSSSAASRDQVVTPDIYDEVAYAYDGTLEGLLSAIFASYANHENPTDVEPEQRLQPRLGQRVCIVPTNNVHAERVYRGLCEKCGYRSFEAVKRAALSDEPDAGSAAYRFVHYAMDEQKRRACPSCRKKTTCKARGGIGACPRQKGRALSDITHPAVERLFQIERSVNNECEHMRQFIRFQHLQDGSHNIWFARCNPKASVIPLVMNHFVERFNAAPFLIYDEVHHLCGVYDGGDWHLVDTDGLGDPAASLPACAADETLYTQAWKTFYRSVSIDARHNPELRQHFMPKRLWKNITEMQSDLAKSSANFTSPTLKQPSA